MKDNIRYIDDGLEREAVYDEYYDPACNSNTHSYEHIRYEMAGVCTNCGCPVDYEGEALCKCLKSPIKCKVCGYRPCLGLCYSEDSHGRDMETNTRI